MKNLRSILSRFRPIHSLVCLAALFASPVVKGQTAALPQESYVPAIDVQIIMPEPNGTQARAVAERLRRITDESVKSAGACVFQIVQDVLEWIGEGGPADDG